MYCYVLQDYENRSPVARQGSRKVVFFMTYYIGVDIAKFVHYACIIDHLGEVHQTSFPFDNSADGFQLFLSKFFMIKAMLSSVLNRPLIIMKISFSFMLKIVYDQRHNCIVPICFKLLLPIFPFLNLDNAIFNFIIYQL